jgi:tight adherence protein B
MATDLRLADSHLQPVDVIIMRLALAGVGFVLPFLFLPGVFGIILGAFAGFVGFMAPQVWLTNRKNGRRKKIEEQLPEALTFVANSLKAGFGLMQALSMAADQLQHPIATEFAQTVHETNIGSSTEEAFLAFGERCVSYDVDLVVTAVLIQRSAGGNLAEILETVAGTMRERVRIRGEITTLTAQQQLTGVVIALLPVGVGGMFLMVSPDYIMVLFTELMGQVMLGMALFLEVIGVIIIRRILAIEV